MASITTVDGLVSGAADALTTSVTNTSWQAVGTTSIADAINGLGLSIKASVVSTDQGTVLRLASTESGAHGVFTLTGIPGVQVATQGKDAQISVGSGAGAYTLSSSTNTFTNVMPRGHYQRDGQAGRYHRHRHRHRRRRR